MSNHEIRGGIALLFIIVASFSAVYSQPTVVDGIAAVVGKEPIFISDVNAQAEYYAFANHIDRNTPGLKQKVLEAMINEKLILVKAIEDTTLIVKDEEVTLQLEALIAERIRQVGSEKKLEELYGMPINRMKREFRDQTRKQLLVQYLQQKKFGDIQVTRREVEEFFEQYKDSLPKVPEELELYHIFRFVKISETVKNSIRSRLSNILDSIKAGDDFADFARRYSEDPATAKFGGDLGFIRRGELYSEFEKAVFSLQKNQISDIVETPLGFHIIQLVERRGEQVHPRHILFKFTRDPAEEDSTVAFLKGLRDSVAHGADFSDLAKRYSEDKDSGPLGGYLGRLPVTQFDESLLKAVENLQEGEISNPVEVSSSGSKGFQIVYLRKRIPEHPMNLSDDWRRVEQLATSYKRTLQYQEWIQDLRKEIYWDVRQQ